MVAGKPSFLWPSWTSTGRRPSALQIRQDLPHRFPPRGEPKGRKRKVLNDGIMHPLARTPEEWSKGAIALGGRAFHGKQIFRWMQARGVTDPSLMTDLPVALRGRLAEEGVAMPAAISSEKRSADSTRKLLVRMADG